jgi:hypothetical protein
MVDLAEPARKPATYEDLCAVPDDRIAEILDGELLTFPRPALAHSSVASALGMDLGTPFQRGRGGPGGWVILDEPELHLQADILVPDLAGWRRERAPDLTAAFATAAPDWVCEVLSPSTRRVDRVKKLPIYLRERVDHSSIRSSARSSCSDAKRRSGSSRGPSAATSRSGPSRSTPSRSSSAPCGSRPAPPEPVSKEPRPASRWARPKAR